MLTPKDLLKIRDGEGSLYFLNSPLKINIENSNKSAKDYVIVFDSNWNRVDIHDETKVKLHNAYAWRKTDEFKKYNDVNFTYDLPAARGGWYKGYVGCIIEPIIEGLYCYFDHNKAGFYHGDYDNFLYKEFECNKGEPEQKCKLTGFICRDIVEDSIFLQIELLGTLGERLKMFFADYVENEEELENKLNELQEQINDEAIKQLLEEMYPG
jgi:hypothetical protein